MSALLQICRTRAAVAVLASGVVISLTALTGGVAPALAAPHKDPVTPTTTYVEAPPLAAADETEAPEVAPPDQKPADKTPSEKATGEKTPSQKATAEETPAEKATAEPAPEAPAPVATPGPAATVAPPVAEAPTPPRVADPAPAVEAPVTTEVPRARTRAPQTEAPAPQTEPVPPALEAPEAPVAPTESATATTTRVPDVVAPPTTTGETTTAQTDPATPDDKATATSTAVLTQAALEIEPVKPRTLKAAPADVELAKSMPPVEQQPIPAVERDVAVLASAIKLADNDNRARLDEADRRDSLVIPARAENAWDRRVRQWDPDWVRYDEYYRPILSNPYRDPVRIVYVYDNTPRIAIIPALASIVLDVVRAAAYSFTALLLSPLNAVLDVAVGSFFGAGYMPALGLPLPPPPPPVLRYDNVPVQVRYSDAVYQPFRVQRVVDVGDDARYGERKVLLDGTTPAWGTWTQTPSGERLFEVHKTQQYPGLDEPREVPLPGDYRLKLAADDASPAPSHRTAYLVAAALACAGLSVSAMIGSVLLDRRRPQH